MRTMQFKVAPIVLVFSMAGFHATAGASGFALIEQSASGQGNAYAGAGAAGDDASTVFFNPAAMTRISGSQVVFAGHFIKTQAEFSDGGSKRASGAALGGAGDDGGVNSVVPNFYYLTDIGQGARFGLGINAPFGLATEYDDNWIGRYHAIKSEVATININPSVAGKPSDRWSIGAGFNIQRIEAELSSAIDVPTLTGGLVTQDGKAVIEGDDTSYGYNLGAIFEITPEARLGMHYRSSIKHKLEGDARFSNIPPGALSVLFQNTTATADIKLPESLSLSYFNQVSDQLAVLADVTWTAWHRFEELRIDYASSLADSVTTEDWDDTYRYSLGMNYTLNSKWLLRAGLAYDQSPVPSAERRTPRVPDSDRTWLSMGGRFTPSQRVGFDFGYTHLFVDDADVNNTAESGIAALRHALKGEYDSAVDILSAQVVYNF